MSKSRYAGCTLYGQDIRHKFMTQISRDLQTPDIIASDLPSTRIMNVDV